MIQSFGNILKIPELRKRIFFTVTMLAVYRLGCQVPTPGVDSAILRDFFANQAGSVLGILNLFTGGALERSSVLALGIMPYISASIIMQLLTPAIPALERLSKEGESGRKKMTQITRYATVGLCMIQGYGMTHVLRNLDPRLIPSWDEAQFAFQVSTVITLTTGTVFLMWMGEQISEKGIGNGMSLLIFAGIVAALPSQLISTARLFQARTITPLPLIVYILVMFITIVAIIYIQQGYRRIPVQYAKRIVGRRMFAGQSSQIPLKIDYSGVIAVIFASTILTFPAWIGQALQSNDSDGFLQVLGDLINRHLAPQTVIYTVVFGMMIVFFCYFYTAVVFQPVELAENLKKQGGFIPGIRPGKPTAEYIDRILSRIILWGALAIAAIAIVPDFISRWGNIPIQMGGTSLLIIVGVALDTMKQVESHLLMRHYDGFMRRGRLKGRTF